MMARERLVDIDRAKGLAIALVVLGHVVAREPPKDAEWFERVKGVVYLFHMPFFMFLSGFVTYYAFKPLSSVRDYGTYVWRRFIRLIPAYLLFSIIVYLAKYYGGRVLHVDNPVRSFEQFWDIFIRPGKSFSEYLWYVYVLFFLTAACAPLFALPMRRWAWFIAPCIGLAFLPMTEYLALDRFFFYLPFFLFGAVLAGRWKAVSQSLDRLGAMSLAAFLAALILCYLVLTDMQESVAGHWYANAPKLLMGALSIPALLALVRHPAASRWTLLSTLGDYTFPIYLMNTLAIGGVKGVMLKWVSWDGWMFLLFLPILFIAGIAIPVLIKRHVIRRVRVLNQMIA